MALLDQALTRNPQLLAAAIELHQAGRIPAATQLIDLDAVAENGKVLAQAAERHKLRVFAMTKQNGLNPFMTRLLIDQGLHAVVALEALQAHRIHRYGFPLGAVGHLQNLPHHQVRKIVAMRPEFISVYSLEAAKRVSEAARELGVHQKLSVRVTNPGPPEEGSKLAGVESGAFSSLVGGWTEADCVKGIAPLLDLPHVSVAGLMQFGGILYGAQVPAAKAQPTAAFFTMLRAKEKLEKVLGLKDLRLITGGEANAVTFATLARYGVTEVEPGMALTGCGSFHAVEPLPEKPAQAVVTEVTHFWQNDVYTVGGVFAFVRRLYDTEVMNALAGRSLDEARQRRMEYLEQTMVDCHGVFGSRVRPAIGDTAVICHHPQHFLERGYTAAVSGIATGKPVVEGLFDAACTELDEDFNPIERAHTLAKIERVAARYRPPAVPA